MTNVIQSIGVVYCATGKKYIQEAIISIQSLIALEPEISIRVNTDSNGVIVLREKFMDRIYIKELKNPSYSWNDKIEAITNSPFERTIYLDTDTFIIRPIAEVLNLALDYFEVLAQPGMEFNLDWEKINYPDCLSQFNTGVIVIKSSPATIKMLQLWQELRSIKPESHDQPTFREAVILSGVRFAPLKNEYNFQGASLTTSEVTIIHLINKRTREMFSRESELRRETIEKIRASRIWSFNHASQYGFIVYNGEWQIKTLLRIVWFEGVRKKYLRTPYRIKLLIQIIKSILNKNSTQT